MWTLREITESEKWLNNLTLLIHLLIQYLNHLLLPYFFLKCFSCCLFIRLFVLLQNLYDKPPSYSSLRSDSNMEAMKLQQILLKKDNQVCIQLFCYNLNNRRHFKYLAWWLYHPWWKPPYEYMMSSCFCHKPCCNNGIVSAAVTMLPADKLLRGQKWTF